MSFIISEGSNDSAQKVLSREFRYRAINMAPIPIIIHHEKKLEVFFLAIFQSLSFFGGPRSPCWTLLTTTTTTTTTTAIIITTTTTTTTTTTNNCN
jgi:hypothetical protein